MGNTLPSPLPEPPEDAPSYGLRPQEDLFCGAVAGCVARMSVAPLDVLKIRFQVQKETQGLYNYSTVASASRAIIRAEGVRGFWRGNMPAMLMVVPYASLQFAAFYQLQQSTLLPLDEKIRSLTFGGIAGAIATLGTYPLDLIRTRLAAEPRLKAPRSMGGTVKRIYRERGVLGLYAGLGPTLVEIVPYIALQYTLYEGGKRYVLRRKGACDLSPPESLVLGAGAGTLSKLATLPLDNAKKRMQVQGQFTAGRPGIRYNSFVDVLRKTIRKEGIVGWFRGSVPSILKAAPNSAITFAVYEQCKLYILSRP